MKIKKILKELVPYIVILIVVVLIRTYLVTPVIVNGSSMEETLYNGDILLLNKVSDIERFDIVVASYKGEKLIKRVIGVPGDNVRCVSGILYINNEEDTHGYGTTDDFPLTTLKEDEYFLVGDNRENSLDSRIIGAIKKEDIEGVVNIRLFPFSKIGKVS